MIRVDGSDFKTILKAAIAGLSRRAAGDASKVRLRATDDIIEANGMDYELYIKARAMCRTPGDSLNILVPPEIVYTIGDGETTLMLDDTTLIVQSNGTARFPTEAPTDYPAIEGIIGQNIPLSKQDLKPLIAAAKTNSGMLRDRCIHIRSKDEMVYFGTTYSAVRFCIVQKEYNSNVPISAMCEIALINRAMAAINGNVVLSDDACAVVSDRGLARFPTSDTSSIMLTENVAGLQPQFYWSAPDDMIDALQIAHEIGAQIAEFSYKAGQVEMVCSGNTSYHRAFPAQSDEPFEGMVSVNDLLIAVKHVGVDKIGMIPNTSTEDTLYNWKIGGDDTFFLLLPFRRKA